MLPRFDGGKALQILEAYGLSETSPVASSNRRDRERKPGSIGVPIDGVEMRVIDDDNKYSRRVWLVDALPEGPTGTILKREIKVPDPIVSASVG